MGKVIAIIAAALVVIVGGYYYLNTKSSSPAPAVNEQQSGQAENANEPSSGTSGAVNVDVNTDMSQTLSAPAAVAITNFTFSPKELRVKAGTKVVWTNNDAAPHTATSDTGAFDSKTLAKGISFSSTFNTKGTFKYHCALHPSMTGTVVVE